MDRSTSPAQGGVIVAGNHLSYADWAGMALFVHQAGRYPAFLIKSSAFNVKWLGPFLHACGQLPVNRGSTDAALVLKEAERAVEHGECVIIYPEGTATRDPGQWPMVAKTGMARMALATGFPVIPVATWGAQEILPYGSKKPHLVPRHTVRMLAGPAVDLSAYAGQPLSRDVLRGAARPRSWRTSLACWPSSARKRRPHPPTIPPPRAAPRGRQNRNFAERTWRRTSPQKAMPA